MYYLFVHFRETRTPDGEQVHFAVSNDGFHWEALNNGAPVLKSNVGEQGVRDFTITRTKQNEFVILATDLSLANRAKQIYGSWEKLDWSDISEHGSKKLIKWVSKDLIHWSEAEEIMVADDDYGCVWAPDVIFDENMDRYMVHWSSSHKRENYKKKKIFYSFTKDFKEFSAPQVLFEHETKEVIDSCTFSDKGKFYCFVKIEGGDGIRMLVSDCINEGYHPMKAFETASPEFTKGGYEAPTVFRLPDQRICLMLDFYGTSNKNEQGYVPFLCDDIEKGLFYRADEDFDFPYGFKHGTVLQITEQEYEKLKEWSMMVG